jgi:transcriptional regulator with XRE-family HTH domain
MEPREKKVESSGDPLNAAVAAILKAKRYEIDISYDQLAIDSGVLPATLNRMLFDKRLMRMTDFFAVAEALRLDPLDVLARAKAAVAQQVDVANPAAVSESHDVNE